MGPQRPVSPIASPWTSHAGIDRRMPTTRFEFNKCLIDPVCRMPQG